MEQTLFKTYKAEIKEVDPKSGEIEMLIPLSTNSIDREGEVIEPSAFKKVLPKFMKHPVLVASHNYGDLLKQIGEWTKLKITDNGLEGRPKYYVNEGNPEADWAFNLASKGRAAFSIGFIPDMDNIVEGDGLKTPRRTYKNINDLLEISQCIIPSNRDAIQTIRAKSVDPIVKTLCDEVEKDLDTLVIKPETTEAMFRIPVSGEEGKHNDHKIRTIDISKDKGIKALYCIDDKKNITYMFDKEKWGSMEECQNWMKDHMGKSASQEQIKDEIDYLNLLITENGMNESVEKAFIELVNKFVELGLAWDGKVLKPRIITTEGLTNLTVKIDADTTELQKKLNEAEEKITTLQEKIKDVTQATTEPVEKTILEIPKPDYDEQKIKSIVEQVVKHVVEHS